MGLGWDKAKADAAAAKVAKAYIALNCSTPGAVDKVAGRPRAAASPRVATTAPRSTSSARVEIDGSEIADATSGYQPGPNGQPTSIVEVALSFKDAGKAKFADVTKRLYGLQSQPPLDQFAVVLDKAGHHGAAGAGRHHRRPGLDHRLVHHRLAPSELAEQLKFGALPMSFALQTQDNISPQLGQEQLRMGLLAGVIGLLLVFVYSLFQYRALGLVTVASLVVAGGASPTSRSRCSAGRTASASTMAGVTGLIVAIGVTAD